MKRAPSRPTLAIEHLESRLAPANVSSAGNTLNIAIDNLNEQITVTRAPNLVQFTSTHAFTGTAPAGFTIGGPGNTALTGTDNAPGNVITAVALTDALPGASVVFSTMTADFTDSVSITLSQPGSGNVRFNADARFTANFSASTESGLVTSASAAHVQFVGLSGSLTSDTRDVILLGRVTTAATTSLTLSANGTGVDQRVQAGNFQNALAGPVAIRAGDGGSEVRTSGNLRLGGASVFGPGAAQFGRHVLDAVGDVTDELGASIVLNGGELVLHSSGGNVVLDSTANQFDGTGTVDVDLQGVAASATLVSDNGIVLGDVRVPGQLAVTTNNGTIADSGAGQSVRVVGPTTLTVDGTADVSLGGGEHRFGGAVTIVQGAGGNIQNVSLRNTLATAAVPTFLGLSLNAGDLNDLTLFFDNAGVTLPALTIAGDLTVTTGGNIAQTAAVNVNGDVAFTVLGNHALTLGANNLLGGTAQFDARHSAQPVTFKTTDGLTLASSNFGRGDVALTGLTISQTGAVVQQPRGGTVTLTTVGGATIDLGTQANLLTGPVVFTGGVTDVAVRTASPLARMADFSFAAGVTDLTVTFDNAPLTFTSFLPGSVQNLTAKGAGIFQSVSLDLADATFDAGAGPILLNNPQNSFQNVTLRNTGASAVTLVANNNLNLAGATVGSGRLLVQANGDITQSGAIVQELGASRATFVVLQDNDVTLNTVGNDFTGPVYVTAHDSQVTLRDGNVLELGTITTQGDLIIPGAAQVRQAAGTSLSAARLNVTTGGGVTLDNPYNAVSGTVTFTTPGGVTLRAAGAVTLGNVNAGQLTLTAGGAVTQAVGTGVVVGGVTAIDAGVKAITLVGPSNNFGTLSLTSLGAAAPQVTEASGVILDKVRLGTAGLTLVSTGAITQAASGAMTQAAGGGTLTFTAGASSSLTLNAAANNFSGGVNVVQASGVTLRNRGDLNLTPSAALVGAVALTAGGSIDLSGLNLSAAVDSFAASARQTTLTTDLSVSVGGITFDGAALLAAGPLTLQTQGAGDVTFNGDVTVAGDLTLDVADGDVRFTRGTWSQGANNLTVLGPTGGLRIGTAVLTDPDARFVTTGGTVDLAAALGLVVNMSGVIQVGTNAAASETATFDIGNGTLGFDGGSLQVGLGAAPDKLLIKGSGLVNLGGADSGSRLLATGLAPAAPTPVVALAPNATAAIVANFANAPGAVNTPFFTGQDLAQADYTTGEAVTVVRAGAVSPTGSVTLFTADGDKVTVTSSGGAAAGLVVREDDGGSIVVVVRNNPVAWGLTITTTPGGGDGLTRLDGLGVNGPGSIVVVAPTVNLAGDVRADGGLVAMTVRDVGVDGHGRQSTVRAGGGTLFSTLLTARNVAGLTVDVAGTLSLTAVNVGSVAVGVTDDNRFTAQRFGSVVVTGSTAAGLAGSLFATLTSRVNPAGMALAAASVAGPLGGTWDLNGAVGTVRTAAASGWSLGASGSQALPADTGVTAVTSLNLGIADHVSIDASGGVGLVMAADWNSGSLRAAVIGTVAVTGGTVTAPVTGSKTVVGDLNGVTIQATGANATGVAFSALGVAGSWIASPDTTALTAESGSVGTIAVGRSASGVGLLLRAGRLTSLTAGAISNVTVDARSVGSIAAVGHAAGNVVGNISNLAVTVRGNAGGMSAQALGTLSAQRQISGLTLTALAGNVLSITAGRDLQTATITLADPMTGALGSIQAANWSGFILTAKAIGSVKAVAVPYLGPDTPFQPGNMANGQVRAFLDAGAGMGIGTFSVAGNLGPIAVSAGQGIGTFVVGRAVQGGTTAVVADGPNATIGALVVGTWQSARLAANSLGTARVTGFSAPDLGTPAVLGQISGADWVIGTTGATAINSLSVQGNVVDTTIQALASINALVVGGSLTGASRSTLISAVAPLATAPGAAGRIGVLVAGQVDGTLSDPVVVRATSFGTFAVIGSAALGRPGNATALDLSARGQLPTGVSFAAFSVTGNYTTSALTAAGSIGTFTVGGAVADNAPLGVGVDPVTAVNSAVVALPMAKVGQWRNTDLFARSVGTFAVSGNAVLGVPAGMTGGYVQVFGSNGMAAPVALAAFASAGAVRDSAIDVLAGNVTSFTALAFLGSDLLVGATLARQGTLDGAPTFGQLFSIGTFKTTAAFVGLTGPSDQQLKSASFADSNVVAARLGTVTLSGVNPDVSTNVLDMLFASENFGLAFKLGPTGSPGTVTINGGAVPLVPPVNGPVKFRYKGF